MNAKQLFIHALTPLHPGTGQGVGVIDLPIAREVATGIPYLPGSSFKGVLRDHCKDKAARKKLFGPDTVNASDHAGAVQFTDTRLLLLPVRSLAGTFAWVTSPFMLKRLLRDRQTVGDRARPTMVSKLLEETKDIALVAGNNKLSISLDGEKKIILEDLSLTPKSAQNARLWAEWLAPLLFPDDQTWQDFLTERFCIVHDDIFKFLLETATQITARIKMEDDSKTVAQGGLWYEEALPAESILYGLLTAQQVGKDGFSPIEALNKISDLVQGETLQFGGGATVGRGLCRLTIV